MRTGSGLGGLSVWICLGLNQRFRLLVVCCMSMLVAPSAERKSIATNCHIRASLAHQRMILVDIRNETRTCDTAGL
eukprot:7588106-Pyramimonas_sp.AAC.2